MSTTPIEVPSYLSDENAGIATADVSCGNGCMAEQGDPCGTGEWCGECSCQGWECGEACSESPCDMTENDCGACQSWGQGCDSSEYGPCNVCEGWCESSNQSGDCSQSCSESCSESCSCQYGCEGCEAACEYSSQRPANASWTTTIAVNSQIKLTAAEWNAFTAAINSFRTYKRLDASTFTTVAAGEHIRKDHFTQARSAINDMSPPSPVPDVPGVITAASLNGLMASLNSIT